MYLSCFCLFMHVLVALCCLALIIFVFIAGENWLSNKYIMLLEIIINLFIIIDIGLRMKVLSIKIYFKSISNIIDFVLLIIIAVLFCVYMLASEIMKGKEFI